MNNINGVIETTKNLEERGIFDFTTAVGSVINGATQAAASLGSEATHEIGAVVQSLKNDFLIFENFISNELNTLKNIKNGAITILIVLFTMILMYGIANCAQCIGFWWNVPKKIVNFVKSPRGKKNTRGNLNDLPLEERGLNNDK